MSLGVESQRGSQSGKGGVTQTTQVNRFYTEGMKEKVINPGVRSAK